MPGGFRRKRVREEQRVRVDGNGLMRAAVGEAGLADEDLVALGARIGEGEAALERHHRTAFTALPPAKGDLKRIVALTDEIRGAFDDLVVLANGGIAHGIRALASALVPSGAALRLHVVDPFDPDAFAALLAGLDLRRTLFDVISGRGDALPTVARFLVVRERLLKELGALEYRRHVVVTTDATDGPLRQIVNDEGFRDLTLPSEIAEDAALLTGAGLFPLAAAGHDVAELVAGAADMAERCRHRGEGLGPAQLLAAALVMAGTRPETTTTSAPLHDLARWIADRMGAAETAGASAPPLAIFLAIERSGEDIEIPKTYADLEGVGYLGGQGLAALAAREQEAQEIAHWNVGRQTLTLRCPARSAGVIGQLVYLAEAAALLAGVARTAAIAETDTAARLLYGLAGRAGYEAERAEGQRLAGRREARYVV